MASAAPALDRPRSSNGGNGSPNWRGIITTVIAALVLSGITFLLGIASSDATKSTQIINMQAQINDLQSSKVSKEQFVEFQRSFDDLRGEMRLLRQELSYQRERKR